MTFLPDSYLRAVHEHDRRRTEGAARLLDLINKPPQGDTVTIRTIPTIDRSRDAPELRADECRISLTVYLPDKGEITSYRSHCRELVVNPDYQICERHNDDRQRMIASDKRKATNGR